MYPTAATRNRKLATLLDGSYLALGLRHQDILAALERNHGNRTLTAQQLKIGPATLFRKLKDYADGHWSLLFLTEVARRCIEFSGTV